ncbi:MAG TPA: peptidase S1, partial [Actinoplanes sp.]|nr:peptidase S1 [Actinoplanes sp.]
MTYTGLGAPRGPEFRSPDLTDRPPGVPAPAHARQQRPAGSRWPLLAAGGLAVIAVAAGTGGAAGYLAGGGDAEAADQPAAAPPPAGVPSDLVAA